MDDEYWRYEANGSSSVKTLKEILKRRGYKKLPSDSSLEQLRKQEVRMRKGLLNYHDCNNADLLRFIRDRSLGSRADLALKRKNIVNRKQMIEMLEEADGKETFDHFLDLPNELQIRVAEFCLAFGDFVDPGAPPTQPPLARTSRHLHALSLPIFYGSHEFIVQYMTTKRDGGRGYKLIPPSRVWFSSVSEGAVACIRSLDLLIPGRFIAVIKLDKTAKGYNVSVHVERGSYDDDDERWIEVQLKAIKQELRAVLDNVEWVDGLRRIKTKDIHALRPALEAALDRANAAVYPKG